jgi:hypothetical protein
VLDSIALSVSALSTIITTKNDDVDYVCKITVDASNTASSNTTTKTARTL